MRKRKNGKKNQPARPYFFKIVGRKTNFFLVGLMLGLLYHTYIQNYLYSLHHFSELPSSLCTFVGKEG